MDTEAAHVSAMLRIPGVFSYRSIHCSTSNGSIWTILDDFEEEGRCGGANLVREGATFELFASDGRCIRCIYFYILKDSLFMAISINVNVI
jgi:hypothetical protein